MSGKGSQVEMSSGVFEDQQESQRGQMELSEVYGEGDET